MFLIVRGAQLPNGGAVGGRVEGLSLLFPVPDKELCL